MSERRRKFSPEFRDEAVKMVVGGNRPAAQVARELGINPGTLTNWVNSYRKAHPVADEQLSVSERARLRELERENQRLRMQAEFLKRAAAFFASHQP
jgi:transposase